jgi:uncharacterized membrane protein
MNTQTFIAKAKTFIVIGTISMFMGCAKSGYNEVMVYNNNFKSGTTDKLTGAILYKTMESI